MYESASLLRHVHSYREELLVLGLTYMIYLYMCMLSSVGTEYSYWLASQFGATDEDIPEGTEAAYVSRCSVCEIDTPTLTIHSHNNETTPCPPTWVPLWEGYSYLMVSRSTI